MAVIRVELALKPSRIAEYDAFEVANVTEARFFRYRLDGRNWEGSLNDLKVFISKEELSPEEEEAGRFFFKGLRVHLERSSRELKIKELTLRARQGDDKAALTLLRLMSGKDSD